VSISSQVSHILIGRICQRACPELVVVKVIFAARAEHAEANLLPCNAAARLQARAGSEFPDRAYCYLLWEAKS